jgi:hypothetical protein
VITMSIFHILGAALVFLFWAAHQHITTVIAGNTFSVSVLLLVALLMGLALLALILAIVRALVSPYPLRALSRS